MSLRYRLEELRLERIIRITRPGNLAFWRVVERCGLALRDQARGRGLDVIWYFIDQPGLGDRG
jgi:RimJ/RimL family protein N-acetyltransferase